ncbi:hypothetical protein AVEN_62346-1 [Araneus ventricosus]|uniref:Uncharacterized protein n=1 Tax=Araneus ventricosus TaxID=182803 RepID=A0A4Y2K7L8_ARAVE|nr:hypothetical protein AVEN_62346-1 [Araneus ventricosus]
MRTTPEPAPLLRTTPAGGRSGPIHGGSSVESGFEPETLLLRSRDLTRLPRPCTMKHQTRHVVYEQELRAFAHAELISPK